MITNLLKLCLRVTVNGIITFLDAVLPPLLEERPALKSAAAPDPEPPAPEPVLQHIGTYPIASHAEMFVTEEFLTPEQPEITTVVIHLPPSPTPAIQAITEVLTCTPGRTALVEALLDEAWSQGLRTYAQLIKYVELQTGTGCSKKTVSAWKKSRRLIETEEQIAA